MNDKQFMYIMKTLHNVDCTYWPPEVFNSHARYDYIPYYDKLRTPIIVLHANCEPFRKRMTGEIVDNWITKESFKPIAESCCELLSKIDGLEEWQLKLKNVFEDMMQFD